MSKAIAGALAGVVLLLLIGCATKEGIPPSDELIPDSANLVARLQVDKVLKDRDIADLYAAIPKDDEDLPPTLQGLLDKGQEELGIDFRVFTQVVLFGDIEREEELFGLIAKGSFEKDSLLLAIKRALEESDDAQFSPTTEYKGHTLNTFVAEDGEEGALAFLDDETLLFGTADVVRQVIDVLEGDRKVLSGAIMDNYNALGDPWFKLAFKIPAEALEELGELQEEPADIPLDLSAFTDIQVLGVSMDKVGEAFKTKLAVGFAAADSASRAGEALNGALSLFRSFLAEASLRDLLGRIEVSASGATLTIGFDTTATEIRGLIENPPDLDLGDFFQ